LFHKLFHWQITKAAYNPIELWCRLSGLHYLINSLLKPFWWFDLEDGWAKRKAMEVNIFTSWVER
jgi:hypothetical protein